MFHANEYMKDHILNCVERYEDMIDHRSYTHNFESSLFFFRPIISQLLKMCE